MSESTVVAIIMAVPPTLVALAAFIQAVRNSRQTANLKHDIDGRMGELLKATGAQGVAEGRLAEQSHPTVEVPLAPQPAIPPPPPPPR